MGIWFRLASVFAAPAGGFIVGPMGPNVSLRVRSLHPDMQPNGHYEEAPRHNTESGGRCASRPRSGEQSDLPLRVRVGPRGSPRMASQRGAASIPRILGTVTQ